VASRWVCSVLWILFYLGPAYFMVLPVRAAEYVITPSVTLRETYDDNVYFRDVDDFEHLISPALELDGRTDLARVQTACAWDISKYPRHDELDSVDQRYRLSGTVSPNPLLQLNISGRYAYDYTFVSTLEESGLVAERSRRTSATVQPGATFILDPRNTLEFSYEFNKTRYDFERYPDYVVHGLNLTWFHALRNERTRIICLLGGNWADFDQNDGEVRQRTCRALAGIDHQWRETLQVTLTAGAHYTESKFPKTELVFVPPASFTSTTTNLEEDDRGFIVDGTLNWRLEPITLSASVNRDVAPSIYGENITRDRVRAALTYRLSDNIRCTLATAYYRNETEGFVQEEKWQTYSARCTITYQFTEDINLQLGYAYTWTENRITDRSEDRNRIFLQLATAWSDTID